MDLLGWDSCDIIIVTGDAYVDHPSFGMAIIGRLLEAQGFRVGIIAQPNWQSKDDFMKLGEPNLFFGVAAGNMDSMINRYTADKKIRSDDATPLVAWPAADRTAPAWCTASAARKPTSMCRSYSAASSFAAPHRPLRLLAGQGPPFDPDRRQRRHPALRQRRACGGGSGSAPGQWRDDREHH